MQVTLALAVWPGVLLVKTKVNRPVRVEEAVNVTVVVPFGFTFATTVPASDTSTLTPGTPVTVIDKVSLVATV